MRQRHPASAPQFRTSVFEDTQNVGPGVVYLLGNHNPVLHNNSHVAPLPPAFPSKMSCGANETLGKTQYLQRNWEHHLLLQAVKGKQKHHSHWKPTGFIYTLGSRKAKELFFFFLKTTSNYIPLICHPKRNQLQVLIRAFGCLFSWWVSQIK